MIHFYAVRRFSPKKFGNPLFHFVYGTNELWTRVLPIEFCHVFEFCLLVFWFTRCVVVVVLGVGTGSGLEQA